MAEAGIEHGDGMAPNYELRIEGLSLSEGVTQFIERVEYESADGLVDMMKVSVMNPDFHMSERKLFLPGNEMALWIGYGPDLSFVGRAEIVKVRTTFPPDGMPGLSITGYTKDHRMAERRPDPGPDEEEMKALDADIIKLEALKARNAQDASSATAKAKTKEEKKQIADRLEGVQKALNTKITELKTKKKVRTQAKAVWNGFTVEEVVTAVAANYGFQTDVDEAPELDGNFYQPHEMSDFDFVAGLSNLVGFFFWVDGDEDGKWWLHFKSPANVGQAVQDKIYTFKYNSGDSTTLLTFAPEMLLKNYFTKVVAVLTLPNGKVVKKEFVETKASEWATKPNVESELAEDILGTAASIKLFLNDFSITIPAVDGIRNEAALEWWVDSWIKRHRQEFMTGKGMVVGLESLRARQSHKIQNIGKIYDGSWFFSRVRHVFDSEGGYGCEFDARKEIL